MITAKMRRTGHSSYSITRDRGAPEVADSGGPPAMGRWAGGASPPLLTLSGGELLDVLVTLESCRLAMDHH